MLLEIYFTLLRTVLAYGDYQAMLIIAFLCSLVVFVLAVQAKLVFGNVKPWWFTAFIVTHAYFLLAQLFLAFWYGSAVPLFLFFEPATYTYFLFVMPAAIVYRRIMQSWPMLPWHLVMYLLCLVASLVFWYVMIFAFGVFTIV